MIQRWIVVILALSLTACVVAEGKVRVFAHTPAAPPPPSFDTVVKFLWVDPSNGECEARTWLMRRGLGDAEIDEMIAKAQYRVLELKQECYGTPRCPGFQGR
jgi:hypothetical protein